MKSIPHIVVNGEERKRCCLCKDCKLLAAFNRCGSTKDGLQKRCRVCQQVTDRADPRRLERAAEYYQAHAEEIKARVRKYEPTPEGRQRHNDYIKSYKAANRERIRAEGRAYAAKRREDPTFREQERAWAKAHPERGRQAASRYYARKWGAMITDFTAEQWVETVAYFNGRCAYCGEQSDDLQQEHMAPVSRGGNHTASNIVPACPTCNKRKGARTLAEFLMI